MTDKKKKDKTKGKKENELNFPKKTIVAIGKKNNGKTWYHGKVNLN